MAQAYKKYLSTALILALACFCLWNNGYVIQKAITGGVLTARTEPGDMHDVSSRSDENTLQNHIVSEVPVESHVPQRTHTSERETPVAASSEPDTPVPSASGFQKALNLKCGATTGIPASIKRLADKMLGPTQASVLFKYSKCVKIGIAPRLNAWFWHDSRETLDYNQGYDFRPLRSMANGTVVVDLGANVGDSAVLIWKYNANVQAISLEPSPYTYIYMRWNLIANHVPYLDEEYLGTGKPGVLALWGAASNEGRDILMAISLTSSKHSQMQSNSSDFSEEVPCKVVGNCSAKNRPDPKQKRRQQEMQWTTHTVPGYSIPLLLRKHNISRIGFLKMDCEGCEYETLIPLADSGLLKDAVVTGEAHYRRIADLSCQERQRQQEPDCATAIANMKRVRQLMCYRYRFTSCARIVQCTLFQEKCYAGLLKKSATTSL